MNHIFPPPPPPGPPPQPQQKWNPPMSSSSSSYGAPPQHAIGQGGIYGPGSDSSTGAQKRPRDQQADGRGPGP
eukprot:CAMPEP_0119046110 /NCGR_PEP_ID=MMETSP1177-20130426/44455_1 /TAXON_ID=2985 /ORGANISM="Ochromonas sp, Strain CCMP1899" /LENGTH=72 /DNA_ID=CAMNT_0007018787 /DNA_START=119 /DNA_END=333 /DNA_ORIENTATION=-